MFGRNKKETESVEYFQGKSAEITLEHEQEFQLDGDHLGSGTHRKNGFMQSLRHRRVVITGASAVGLPAAALYFTMPEAGRRRRHRASDEAAGRRLIR